LARPFNAANNRKNNEGSQLVKTFIRATTTAASAALATLLTIGAPSMSAAATFVYVSDAEDATIDGYVLDTKTGALTSIGKTEAGKMAVSPNKKFLYVVVRSQPMRVLTYAIDGKTGALTQKATAPLPDSMPYVSTDRSGRFLFTASYGGDKVAVNPIGGRWARHRRSDPGAADRPQRAFNSSGSQQPLRLFGQSRRQPGAAIRLRWQNRQAHRARSARGKTRTGTRPAPLGDLARQ